MFAGRDPLATLLEPLYTVAATLGPRHAPPGFAVGTPFSLATAVLSVLFPLLAAVVLTGGVALVYRSLGVRRPAVLLAYPAALFQASLLVYAVARRTFVWGGRRYRWRGRHDVTVLD